MPTHQKCSGTKPNHAYNTLKYKDFLFLGVKVGIQTNGTDNIGSGKKETSFLILSDGIMLEVHSNPELAYCDGEQALLPKDFKTLMAQLKRIAEAVDREM